MRALFLDLNHQFYDPHAIHTLSTLLNNETVETAYVSTRKMRTALKAVSAYHPELILYSAFSTNIESYIEFDKALKQENNHIVSIIGGPGVTFDPGFLDRSTIDAACVGEGETALMEFIKSGFKGSKNIFRRGQDIPRDFYPLADLNLLPLSDRRTVYKADSLLRENPSKQFLSGRGCPYSCTYCFNHKFNEMFKGCGSIIRKKSVDYLFEEISIIRSLYPLSNLVFNDDTFIIDKKWFLDFAKRLPVEIGLNYTCNIRANLLDEEIAQALKESGCVGVNWSIESGNDQIRNKLLKRNMTTEQILETSRLLKKFQILNRIGNVIGLPGEKTEQMLETLELNLKARPTLALANIFSPFPGLQLTQYAVESGFLTDAPIPKDFFTHSILNYSRHENDFIYKLFCLFPLFNLFPGLYWNKRISNALFSFPRLVLRFLYEIIYSCGMAKIYTSKTPFLFRIRMAIHHLLNL